MSSPQTPSTTSWPFAFVNGERTKESQQLLDLPLSIKDLISVPLIQPTLQVYQGYGEQQALLMHY